MGKDWRGTPFAKAVDDGCAKAGIYGHARPYGPDGIILNALLDGLDAAGLLLTDERLDEIAERIEARVTEIGSQDAKAGLAIAASMVRLAAQR